MRMMNQAMATMNQLQHKLDLIGNNLANSQTTGYKTRQAEFSDLLFQQIDNMRGRENAVGRLTPDGIRVGTGAKLGSVNINLTPGSIIETGRSLDAALLEKNHLFQIQVAENGVTETRYTREGAFYLHPVENGNAVMLVTKDGHPVLGQNGPIILPDGFEQIEINSNGEVRATYGNNTVQNQIAIVEAIRPRMLEAAGKNHLRLPDGANINLAGIIQQVNPNDVRIQSRALESSNVDIAKEMTDLLMTQRAYQFNARTISMGDQMTGLINQLR